MSRPGRLGPWLVLLAVLAAGPLAAEERASEPERRRGDVPREPTPTQPRVVPVPRDAVVVPRREGAAPRPRRSEPEGDLLQSFPGVAPKPAIPPSDGPGLVVTPTTLEVQLHGGEFLTWTKEVTIHEPGTLRFRWQTGPLAKSAEWQVWDQMPPAFHPKPGMKAHPSISPVTGPLSPIAITPKSFDIEFGPLLPPWPPVPPGEYRRWVTVVTRDAQGAPLGEPAAPVVVIYRAPPPMVEFGCYADTDCPQGQFCDLATNDCSELVFTCPSPPGHLIHGSDGSVADCTPYVCWLYSENAIPVCRTSCWSTADCATGYQCDADARCIQYP